MQKISVIAFFVLLGEELAGEAVLVLLGGAIACGVYFLEYLLTGYFYFAARDKGYEDLFYLFFAWAFPVVDHLLVATLHDRGEQKSRKRLE